MGRLKKYISLIKNLPIGVKASVAYFVSSIITSGIAYLTTPLYTRLLSAEEYGQVSVYYTWVQLFAIVAMFCLSYGVFNNGMVDYPDRRDEYVFSMLALSNVITIIVFILLLAIYPYIGYKIGIRIEYIILMFISFFFQPAFRFWVGKQRYEMCYKAVLLWSVIQTVISPTIAIICITNSTGSNNLQMRILGAEIPLIFIYLLFYISLLYKNKMKVKFVYWRQAFLFNLPLIPHYLSTYLLGSSDKLMIDAIVGSAATAYYSVANSVAAFASIIWTAINGVLVPYTYENCKKENFAPINKVTQSILIVFAVACTGIILFAPEVVWLMATEDYREAIYVIPPIIGGFFFQVQYFVFSNILYYYKKPGYVMVGSITSMALNILLNYVFISKYGYLAAGYTTLFSYVIQSIVDYFSMKKVIKRKIYEIKPIIVLSMVVIIIALLSNMIYDYPIVRYGILGAIIVFGTMNYKKIIKLVLEMKGK